jgi:hypothetical protein
LQASPVLRQEIESVTQSEIRLRGNVVLSTRAGNYRTVRGRTLLAAIIDEVAFLRDETRAAARSRHHGRHVDRHLDTVSAHRPAASEAPRLLSLHSWRKTGRAVGFAGRALARFRGEGCEGLAIQNDSGLPQRRADHSVLG